MANVHEMLKDIDKGMAPAIASQIEALRKTLIETHYPLTPEKIRDFMIQQHAASQVMIGRLVKLIHMQAMAIESLENRSVFHSLLMPVRRAQTKLTMRFNGLRRVQ